MGASAAAAIGDVRFGIDINVKSYRNIKNYDETGVYVPPVHQTATMDVTPLQLAVILRRDKIVRLMLQSVTTRDNEEGRSLLKKMMQGSKTVVHFKEGDLSNYRYSDRMMHGSTAFHLAARFDAESLKLLLNEIKDHEGTMSLVDLNKAGEFGYSALHYAACNHDPASLQ